jgi:hypothetical protein
MSVVYLDEMEKELDGVDSYSYMCSASQDDGVKVNAFRVVYNTFNDPSTSTI